MATPSTRAFRAPTPIEIQIFNQRVDSFLTVKPEVKTDAVKEQSIDKPTPTKSQPNEQATQTNPKKCFGIECVCTTTASNELQKCGRGCNECYRDCGACLQKECPSRSGGCWCHYGLLFLLLILIFALCIFGIVKSNEPLQECRELTRGERYACMSESKSEIGKFAFSISILIATIFCLIHLTWYLSSSACRKPKQYDVPPQCVNGIPNKTVLKILLPKLSLIVMTVMLFTVIYCSQFVEHCYDLNTDNGDDCEGKNHKGGYLVGTISSAIFGMIPAFGLYFVGIMVNIE